MFRLNFFWSKTDGSSTPPPPDTDMDQGYVSGGIGLGIGFRKEKRRLLWWAFSKIGGIYA